jgi:hypothetical protein
MALEDEFVGDVVGKSTVVGLEVFVGEDAVVGLAVGEAVEIPKLEIVGD